MRIMISNMPIPMPINTKGPRDRTPFYMLVKPVADELSGDGFC